MSEAPRNEQQRESAPDFLRRVIDGAFERASPLEPRRPSLFESQAIAVTAAVDWPVELAVKGEEYTAPSQVEVGPERKIHPQTVLSDAPASRELRRTDMDSPSEHRLRAAPEATRLVTTDQEPRIAAGLHAQSPAGHYEQLPERSVLAPKPLPIPLDIHRDSRAEHEREPRHLVLDSPGGILLAQRLQSTTETIREPTIVRAPESREAQRRPTGRSEGLRDHPVASALNAHRIVVEPPTVRHRPEREPLRAEMATPSPEPVVNVTIGRIEVRALPPQPGSTRQRSQGPKPMSLDDYLQQRGGGR